MSSASKTGGSSQLADPSQLGGSSELGGSAAVSTVAVVDLAAVREQLGRIPRGVADVAHRCPCGLPDVLRTEPRLPDGTPFPTTYYATCPRLTGAISTLETSGIMREMTQRLGSDPNLAEAHAAAHTDYLRRRGELGDVAEIDGISAGGMPTRVKCLHVLVGHSLAVGPGVNPLGDEALAALGQWWAPGPCVPRHDPSIVPDVPNARDGLNEHDGLTVDEVLNVGDVLDVGDMLDVGDELTEGDA